jgi:hypothetical protein
MSHLKESNSNFIYVENNFFSEEESKITINKFDNNLTECASHTGYVYKDLFFDNFILDLEFLKSFNTKLVNSLNEYKKLYPEINQTASLWGLSDLRFKKFNKGKSFANFHSEHNISYPNRILGIQLYLSNNNCGTEFYRDNLVIKSEVGKLAIFPAYFTHTHKGQVCPDNNERFIITGYISFNKKGEQE